jgi:glutathione S-transferase
VRAIKATSPLHIANVHPNTGAAAMPDFRLHCFSQSGNAYKAALMLALCGADWEPVFVDFFNGETRRPDWRETVNAMGEVPVLEHEGRRLSQSGVILTYLSRKLGKFGPEGEDDEREILRWMFFDNHKFTSYFATYRFLYSLAPQPGDPAVMAFLKARADGAFAIADKHLAENPFLVGGRPTIADISLAGYMFFPEEEHGYDFAASHPGIHAWKERLSALPGWAGPYDVLPGGKFLAPR